MKPAAAAGAFLRAQGAELTYLVGVGLVTIGVGMLSVPAAFIVAGAMLMHLAWRTARAG